MSIFDALWLFLSSILGKLTETKKLLTKTLPVAGYDIIQATAH